MDLIKKVVLLQIMFIAFAVSAPVCAEEDIELIINEDAAIDQVYYFDLKSVYFGRSSVISNGNKVVPYDLTDDDARKDFYRIYFKKTQLQVDRYWARKLFAGEGVTPPEKVEKSELIEIVRESIEAIGYIPNKELEEGLKSLEVTYE